MQDTAKVYDQMADMQMRDDHDMIGQNPRAGLSGFGMGVILETNEGPQPVEWMRAGDLVLTRDHGYQRVRWVGRSETAQTPPIRVFAHAFGYGCPEHDLVLSPHHHLLMSSPLMPLYFAEDEVLAPIGAMSAQIDDMFDTPNSNPTLCHMLFDQHEVIFAEGVWLESLFPDAQCLELLGATAEHEMRDAIGNTVDTMVTARMVLNTREVALLQPRTDVAARRMVA
ncbi:Hint domain-containing protein [Celeribacter marinus]|nr:Hint domain-containing protein [Celeribacter marinus]SFK07697.1 Hint domain-containing protein [Celeribacter marinus]